MGQKIHPIGFRLGVTRTWNSKWYEEKNYAKWLHEDLEIREYIKKLHYTTGISTIEIERAPNKVKITVHTAKPGVLIGKRGAGVESLKRELMALTDDDIILSVVEVRKRGRWQAREPPIRHERPAQLAQEWHRSPLSQQAAFARREAQLEEIILYGRLTGLSLPA